MVINGDRDELNLEPHRTLADVLRKDESLTSVRLDCADGTCGACTVIVDDEAIRSCLILAVQADGAQVRTVEGLVLDHPLRAALSTMNDVPCVVCVPGLVMLAAGAVEQDPGRLRRLLASNVCRRPGHDKAPQAVFQAALAARDQGPHFS